MTPANKKKFLQIAKECNEIAKENPDSSSCIFFIFKIFAILTQMGEDFHFRPEANDESK